MLVADWQHVTHRLLARSTPSSPTSASRPPRPTRWPPSRGAASRTVRELVDATGQRPSTFTGVLDRLERRGLVARARSGRPPVDPRRPDPCRPRRRRRVDGAFAARRRIDAATGRRGAPVLGRRRPCSKNPPENRHESAPTRGDPFTGAHTFARVMPTDRTKELGRRGEELAAEHFERLGFEVLARNHRTRFGELDLVADDGDARSSSARSRRAARRARPGRTCTTRKRSRSADGDRLAHRGHAPPVRRRAALRRRRRRSTTAASSSARPPRGRVLSCSPASTTFAVDGVEARRVWVEADIRLGPARVHRRRARRQGGARGARARPGGDRRTPASSSRCGGSRSTSRRPTCARSARAFDLPLAVALLVASGQLDAGGGRVAARSSASCR